MNDLDLMAALERARSEVQARAEAARRAVASATEEAKAALGLGTAFAQPQSGSPEAVPQRERAAGPAEADALSFEGFDDEALFDESDPAGDEGEASA
ncbi:MAG TPA: hypothetical protein VNJ51_03965 [Candidatus Dormibacteraeota bacterium]|nr:hypothetical protein [Candidatus Dormibacteraeota bacterium]